MESRASSTLWQRSRSTWAEIRAAKSRYRASAGAHEHSRFTNLASDYYSLAGRHIHGVWVLLGAYLSFKAASYAKKALLSIDPTDLSMNELDVLSRILTKVPKYLGGDQYTASRLVQFALLVHPGRDSALPHTQAHLWVTKALLSFGADDLAQAYRDFDAALSYREKILKEPSSHCKQQLVRVLKSAGAFFSLHGHGYYKERGERLLAEALSLASECSDDQLLKLKAINRV